jgi:hypothetical protein
MTARSRLVVALLACAACAPVAVAEAAGPPLPSSATDAAGTSAPGGTERLVATRAGARTVVTAFRRGGGDRPLRSRRIPGRWSVAPVAIDGATTGLSADGRTLVLVRPTRSFPPATTHLAILDARSLRIRREITLPGFFTVDAIAPHGRRVYLIQYAGDDNFLDYRVRTLDTRTAQLEPRDVVDPRSPGEQMGGLPMTRATSADGRWVYTLYGGGEETFIHALDTVGATAACIDLDMLSPHDDLGAVQLHVSADGRRVAVRDAGTLVATVDARTFAVHEPAVHAARADAPAAAPDGGFPWIVLPVAAAALGAAALRARRRGGPLAPTRAR